MLASRRIGRYARALSFSVLGALLLPHLIGCGGGGGGGGFNPSTNVSVVIFPGSTSVPVNSTVSFTAAVFNATNTAVTWSATNGATFNGNVMTAPASTGTVTVTATSQADNSKKATATVMVTSATPVIVSPAAVAIPAKGTQQFTAASGGLAVTWTLPPPPVGVDFGTIDQNGNYTAPQAPPPGGVVTISATTAAGAGVANVTIIFSNASLKGQYAFSYSGEDSAGFLAVAGSISFDGLGNVLSGGVEDVNSGNGIVTNPITGGTYDVGPDGRATVAFNTSSATITILVTIVSPQHALLVRFDTVATGSGTLDLQNKAQLSVSNVSGFYSFGISGINSVGSSQAIAGSLFADGNGNFPVNDGIQDVNNAGTVTQADVSLHGQIVTFDGNTGRGLLQLISTPKGTLAFAYYMVDHTHLKLVETDTVPVLAGDMFLAPDSITELTLNGNNAFTLGGSVTRGAFAAGGIFTSSGSGKITGGVLDLNANGSVSMSAIANSGSTYSISPVNSHRILLNISSGKSTFNYGVFPDADGSAVMIELDSSVSVASGVAFQQTSAAQPQGNYALNLTAAVGNGQEDINGAIATTSTTAVNGYLDVNSTGSVFPNLQLSGSTIASPTPIGRGTFALQTAAPSTATFPLAYYVVDNQTALIMEIDGQRVAIGEVVRQF